ncbi:hypothetical protein Droror1_Dr00023735 [Drosera rotundifolia]
MPPFGPPQNVGPPNTTPARPSTVPFTSQQQPPFATRPSSFASGPPSGSLGPPLGTTPPNLPPQASTARPSGLGSPPFTGTAPVPPRICGSPSPEGTVGATSMPAVGPFSQAPIVRPFSGSAHTSSPGFMRPSPSFRPPPPFASGGSPPPTVPLLVYATTDTAKSGSQSEGSVRPSYPGQAPTFSPSVATPAGNFPGPSTTRPGAPPPGVVPRAVIPPFGPPQNAGPPNTTPARPSAVSFTGQQQLPFAARASSFASRPPSGSLGPPLGTTPPNLPPQASTARPSGLGSPPFTGTAPVPPAYPCGRHPLYVHFQEVLIPVLQVLCGHLHHFHLLRLLLPEVALPQPVPLLVYSPDRHGQIRVVHGCQGSEPWGSLLFRDAEHNISGTWDLIERYTVKERELLLC